MIKEMWTEEILAEAEIGFQKRLTEVEQARLERERELEQALTESEQARSESEQASQERWYSIAAMLREGSKHAFVARVTGLDDALVARIQKEVDRES